VRQRVGVDLVHVESAGFQVADRRFDILDGIDVNDGFLFVLAYAVHGGLAEEAFRERPRFTETRAWAVVGIQSFERDFMISPTPPRRIMAERPTPPSSLLRSCDDLRS
jgi:hypothetical protein